MDRRAQRFVEIGLSAFELNPACVFSFRRQFVEHLIATATQNESANPCLQFLHLFAVSALFDRVPKDAIEAIEIAEQSRNEHVINRPQFAQMILHRRAGERDALLRFQRLRGDVGFCLRVLKRLRLVKNDDIPLNVREHFFVALQQRIGSQHHVRSSERLGVCRAHAAVVAIHSQRWRETLSFALPVRQH